MKIIYENTVNRLALDVNDESPSACISSVTCDDDSLISIAPDVTLHHYLITTRTLSPSVNSQLVKFKYTIHDTNNNTNNSYEYFLVLKKGYGAGSTSNSDSDITHEDLIYYDILNSAHFDNVYYDIFDIAGSLDIVSGASHNLEGTTYEGTSGDYIQQHVLTTVELKYHFSVHLQTEDTSLFSVGYSFDGGNSWSTLQNDDLDAIVNEQTGFNSLDIRISWLGTASLKSFGIFYNYDVNIGVGGTTLTSGGDITREDLIYYNILLSSPFNKLYYDTFNKADSLTEINGCSYNNDESLYSVSNGNFIKQVIYEGSLVYNNFSIHLDCDDILTYDIKYSIDNEATWISLASSYVNDIINVSGGFTSLSIKFIFTNSGNINSFGVLYDYYMPNESIPVIYSYANKSENWTAINNITAPYTFTLPNNMTYITDGKTLEVYQNGLRLINNIDFAETNNSQITFNKNINDGDVFMFVEKQSYLDNSSDNGIRLDKEHFSDGGHKFIDHTTNDLYTIYIDNGSLYLKLIN